MRSLMTREDEFQKILEDLALENPCKSCGEGTTKAERIANRNWRGIKITCQRCERLVAEIDDPERGWL